MGWIRSSSKATDADGGASSLRVVPANRWRAWAVTAGLWGLVAIGAFGGVVGLMRPPVVAPADEPSHDDAEPIPSPEILGVGEWVVRVAVPASEASSVGAVVAAPADRPQPSGGVLRVVSATAVAAEQVSDGYWTVTVAAEVELVPGDVVQWFFEVGVIDGPSGAYAATDPALVPAPKWSGRRLEPEGTMNPPDPADPSMETVASFVEALLSGDPAVGRWTAPGVEIGPAVSPGTFSDVRATRASITEIDSTTRRVRVEVSATTPTDAVLSLAYEIVVVSRGDRWEVTSMSGAPTLAAVDHGGRSRSTPSSSPSPTTVREPTTSTTAALAPDDGATNPYLYQEEDS